MRNRKWVCPSLSESFQANSVGNKTKMKSLALQATTQIHLLSSRNSRNRMAVGEDHQNRCSGEVLAQASWHLWFFLWAKCGQVGLMASWRHTHDFSPRSSERYSAVCFRLARMMMGNKYFSQWNRVNDYVYKEVRTNLQKWRSKPSHLSLHFRQGAPAPISWPRVICRRKQVYFHDYFDFYDLNYNEYIMQVNLKEGIDLIYLWSGVPMLVRCISSADQGFDSQTRHIILQYILSMHFK